MFTQDEFDLSIGRLDRILSLLIQWAGDQTLDSANRQTLKHHAEDMIGAGEKMLLEMKGIAKPTQKCQSGPSDVNGLHCELPPGHDGLHRYKIVEWE